MSKFKTFLDKKLNTNNINTLNETISENVENRNSKESSK